MQDVIPKTKLRKIPKLHWIHATAQARQLSAKVAGRSSKKAIRRYHLVEDAAGYVNGQSFVNQLIEPVSF